MADNLKKDDNLEKALPNEPKIVGCNVCMLVSYDEKEKLNKFEKAYKQREEREEHERLIKQLQETKEVKAIQPCDVDWDDPNGGWEVMTNIIPYDEEDKKQKKQKKENKYKNMYGF